MLCVKNEGFSASLEVRKLYSRIPDKIAETKGMVRIIDESGEDYLYPIANFIPVSLSQKIMKAFGASG